MTDPREPLGRLVRQTWVEWARHQPDPKPSWLVSWEELDQGQREVDMRIGAAIRAEIAEEIEADALKRYRPRKSGGSTWGTAKREVAKRAADIARGESR